MKDCWCPHSVLILKPSNLHIYSHFWGIFSVLSSNVHCKVLFSDYQGNGAFFFQQISQDKRQNSANQGVVHNCGETVWKKLVAWIALSALFRITFLSSWCWMSPYSYSHFDFLTYARQKQPPGDKQNCGDFLPLSSEGQMNNFRAQWKNIVLFTYSNTHEHTNRHLFPYHWGKMLTLCKFLYTLLHTYAYSCPEL